MKPPIQIKSSTLVDLRLLGDKSGFLLVIPSSGRPASPRDFEIFQNWCLGHNVISEPFSSVLEVKTKNKRIIAMVMPDGSHCDHPAILKGSQALSSLSSGGMFLFPLLNGLQKLNLLKLEQQ
jgi:hypothetical protein